MKRGQDRAVGELGNPDIQGEGRKKDIYKRD